MSAHIAEPLLQTILPGGILVASLLGSAHCISMCGGLVISFAKDPKGLALYHLGRLTSYTLFGAASGALGSAVFNASFAQQAPWMTSAFFGTLLILLGMRRLSGKSLHFALPNFLSNASSRLILRFLKHAESHKGVFTLGALSALLPCGWLYTFVLAASATKSATLGAASLSLFWLGTVPALSAAPMVFNKLTSRMRQVTPRASGILMIGLGLFALGLHASTLFTVARNATPQKPTAPSCPLHH